MVQIPDDPTLELVTLAYGVAVEPEKFDELLGAWDRWLDQAMFSPAADFDPIASIFDNAVEVSTRIPDQRETAPSNFDLAPAPALLFDKDNRVISLNSVAKSFFAREHLDVDELITAVTAPVPAFEESGRAVYRVGRGRRSVLAIEAPVSAEVSAACPAACRMLFLSQIDWNDAYENELRRVLSLSKAELRVARGLLEGLTAQEMADELDRSLATIRTHIKILLQKSGARRQSELIQLLTILRHTSDLDASTPAQVAVDKEFTVAELISDAGALPVVRYGSGRPLLYFTTSSRPEETTAVRSAFARAGFEVLAPVRPGYGTTPRSGVDASEEMLQGWLNALLEECAEPPLLVGHREGGVVALRAAKQLLDAGASLSGLALISTGAPVRRKADWRQSPPAIRRSFMAAQLAPAALSLGYQTAARLFRRGPREQEKFVEYFFVDSPADAALRSHRPFFDVMRDNIEYCFRDSQQVVRDIAAWSSEWGDDLDAVAQDLDVLFAHGTEHSFFPYAAIADRARRSPRVFACPIPKVGQLALYHSPDAIAAALADVFLTQQEAV